MAKYSTWNIAISIILFGAAMFCIYKVDFFATANHPVSHRFLFVVLGIVFLGSSVRSVKK
jgi:uncharacterized membrane protein